MCSNFELLISTIICLTRPNAYRMNVLCGIADGVHYDWEAIDEEIDFVVQSV